MRYVGRLLFCIAYMQRTARGCGKGRVMVRGSERKGGYVIFLFSFTSSLLNLPLLAPFSTNTNPFERHPLHPLTCTHMHACLPERYDRLALLEGCDGSDWPILYVRLCVCEMAVSHIALMMLMMMITWQWEKSGAGVHAVEVQLHLLA